MLSIFVETSCNRYNRDECISCHVYEPLMEHPVSEWHLTLEQARHMAEKIKNVEVLNSLPISPPAEKVKLTVLNSGLVSLESRA